MTSWTAPFIAPDDDLASAPLLRRQFRLDDGHGPIRSASLALSAIGVVEGFLAGRTVSEDLLAPGWTSYEWRLRVMTYDVLSNLADVAPGSSTVLALIVGNGWAKGRLTWTGDSAFYADERAAFAELTIAFEDGHLQTVATDTTWTAHPSKVLDDDFYDGQTIDARRDQSSLLHAGDDDTGSTVHEVDYDHAHLVPNEVPAVRRLREIEPGQIWLSPAGKTLIDFGENLVGWIRLETSGRAGSVITLRHAEVLEDDEIGMRPLRSAKATDRFVLSGGDDSFEPTFTFHGFRFAEVEGWTGTLDELRGAVTAVVVGSELARTGQFRSSSELLNTFHDNVVRGMQGNFLSLPTDCPQRDERLGWTGDIAAFAPTAAYLFDTSAFLGDWLEDLRVETRDAQGIVPLIVPNVFKYLPDHPDLPHPESVAIWSDAAAWVPWALWMAHGDRAALGRQFPAMLDHLRHVSTLLSPRGLWETGFQYGDWLDPDAPPEHAEASKADPYVVATASAYRTATIVAAAALELGHAAEAAEASRLAESLRTAFRTHYVLDDGRILSDCTTVYALAIVFDLLDDVGAARAGDRLAELAAAGGYRISTGFAGTPFITDALTQTGHVDDAYRLLMQTEVPSWLYPVLMGATTVWERWDSMLPDGRINPGEMTSFNHYALGAVADWMHRTVAGIAPLTPGYEHVLIAPLPGGGLTWAQSSLETRYGRLAVDWTSTPEGLQVRLMIPDGVTATVRIPGLEEHQLTFGDHEIVAPALP